MLTKTLFPEWNPQLSLSLFILQPGPGQFRIRHAGWPGIEILRMTRSCIAPMTNRLTERVVDRHANGGLASLNTALLNEPERLFPVHGNGLSTGTRILLAGITVHASLHSS